MNRADRCSVRTCWSFGVTQTNQFLGEVWVNERGQRISRPLTPRRSWLRGLDLNQRPLGYEPSAWPHATQRSPIRAVTEASGYGSRLWALLGSLGPIHGQNTAKSTAPIRRQSGSFGFQWSIVQSALSLIARTVPSGASTRVGSTRADREPSQGSTNTQPSHRFLAHTGVFA